MFPLILAFKNVISRKSSIVIIVFIAFAISLLVFTNSIFDGTDSGLETTFINSFTGDVVIRPKSRTPLSLFGDETPVTGSLSDIPSLVPYDSIVDIVNKTKGVKAQVPQLSFLAALNVGGSQFGEAFFGVPADQYLNLMNGVHLMEGSPYTSGEKGIMLNSSIIQSIQNSTGIRLNIGDNVQVVFSTGSSFTIRSAPLTGIFEYEISNSTLDRIVLIDPVTLRDLMGVIDVSFDESTIDENEKDLMISDFDIDDLFGDTEDVFIEESQQINLDDFKYDAELAAQAQAASSSVWNFIICKTEEGVNSKAVLKNLNRSLKKAGYEAQAINWRTAAGSTVTMIYFIRVIFNIGIIIILATGFIVVNNTLIISALDRIKETGTLRAIGANRLFVTLQFFAETFILTMTAGIIGCVLGICFTNIVSSTHITISNTYLIQLFGNTTLQTAVTSANIAKCMLISFILSVLGSIYPVHVALDSSPVVAMRGVS